MTLARLASRLTAWSVRWIPDPLVIAVALSLAAGFFSS